MTQARKNNGEVPLVEFGAGRKLKDKDFRRLSEFLNQQTGIKLPAQKKIMLESRLHRRLKDLGIQDFSGYCDYLFSPGGMDNELCHLIDVVTTNTTEFFREPQHFQYLVQRVLPEWRTKVGGRAGAFTCWSAGCSSGEEPYTLAMVLSDFLSASPGLDFSILASDVSLNVLNKAARAVYTEERIKGLRPEHKKRYLLRSRDKSCRLVRIAPEIRQKVAFFHLNFMEERWPMQDRVDVVFCRNVLIYFDRPTQERIVGRLCGHLKPGGHLFVGHSESLAGMDLPVRHMGPTIYLRT